MPARQSPLSRYSRPRWSPSRARPASSVNQPEPGTWRRPKSRLSMRARTDSGKLGRLQTRQSPGSPRTPIVLTLDLAAPAIHDAVTQITTFILDVKVTVTTGAKEQKRALQARDLETRQADAIAIVWAIGAILVETSATLDAIISPPFGLGRLVAGLALVVNGLLILMGTLHFLTLFFLA
ncbi:hypothetical protein MAPG_07272 [Magnaporthiopsis poae ATCC 64411]|uniref:Uncharacterized protein n=1 Tax=Magnaporthiopsis poae (strain ATCC 64411 / 73-15) TaxID=644358 RepID=A0A0C4E483_MAGP6|nr:hypothetical protein MAPG_07272 [Magnaporthiopsis poae ATCC 64411]